MYLCIVLLCTIKLLVLFLLLRLKLKRKSPHRRLSRFLHLLAACWIFTFCVFAPHYNMWLVTLFFLLCTAQNTSPSWRCRCSAGLTTHASVYWGLTHVLFLLLSFKYPLQQNLCTCADMTRKTEQEERPLLKQSQCLVCRILFSACPAWLASGAKRQRRRQGWRYSAHQSVLRGRNKIWRFRVLAQPDI